MAEINIAQKIIEILKEDLGYNLALDKTTSEASLNDVLCKLFSEQDTARLKRN